MVGPLPRFSLLLTPSAEPQVAEGILDECGKLLNRLGLDSGLAPILTRYLDDLGCSPTQRRECRHEMQKNIYGLAVELICLMRSVYNRYRQVRRRRCYYKFETGKNFEKLCRGLEYPLQTLDQDLKIYMIGIRDDMLLVGQPQECDYVIEMYDVMNKIRDGRLQI